MIRKAKENDIEKLMVVYEKAQEYMVKTGNANQWQKGYPAVENLLENIRLDNLYVLEDETGIYGGVVLATGEDPTYTKIYDGAWRDNSPYVTIHRVASDGTHRGVFTEMLNYAKTLSNHLRIDTHEENSVMRNLVEKNNFKYCGVIHLLNGDPRVAYEWSK